MSEGSISSSWEKEVEISYAESKLFLDCSDDPPRKVAVNRELSLVRGTLPGLERRWRRC